MSVTKKKIRKNKYKKTPANKKSRRSGSSIFRISFKLNPIPLLTCAAVSAGLVCLTYLLTLTYSLIIQSSVFGASTLTVTGNSRLTEQTVLRHADMYHGRNIFDINLELTRNKLLTHPWIKKAEVIREMPDTIRIRIVEHTPIAIIDFGKKYLINRDGDIFKQYNAENDVLPLVTGMFPQDFNVAGKKTSRDKSKPLEGLMDMLNTLKGAGSGILSAGVNHIEVDRNVGITLVIGTSVKQVRLGYGDYKNKINRLNEVMEILGRKITLVNIDTIDLININRIVVKPVLLEAQV